MKPDHEPSRSLFIARYNSYHGTTFHALDLGGHEARKQTFRPSLANITHHISPCHPYRDMMEGESESQYVNRLAQELEEKIISLGPKNVAGLILEPVVGAVSTRVSIAS